ncbi:MAG: rhomboid family intramembrane serine protease [Planctomycetes bacterium]|nr:rhomboid family intramembrane serine protease [Planctomycetota bacterium]
MEVPGSVAPAPPDPRSVSQPATLTRASAPPSAERFINALSLALIRDVGFAEVKELPGGLPPGIKRVLALEQLAVVLRNGEGLAESDLRGHLIRWADGPATTGLPKSCTRVLLLYVFEGPVPESLGHAVVRTQESYFCKGLLIPDGRASGFSLALGPNGRAASGFVDLARAHVDLGSRPPAEVAAPIADALRSWKAGESMLGTTMYHEGVSAEEKRIGDFMGRLGEVRPWATRFLIAACVGMWLLTHGLAGRGDYSLPLLRLGAKYPSLIRDGEWWRLWSGMFLHVGFYHLLFNMLALLAVGSLLEQYFGRVRYLALYGIAGLAGSLASLSWVDKLSVGASGGIFGLFGAAAWLGRRYRAEIPARARRAVAGGMLPCIGYNLVFGFLVPGINIAAHLGGLVGGFLFALVVPPRVLSEGARGLGLAARALLLVAALAPFAAEARALWRAMEVRTLVDYPQVEYRNLEHGWALRHPGFFRHSQSTNVDTFQGPGVSIEVAVFPLEPSADFERNWKQLLKPFFPLAFDRLGEFEIDEQRGRRWFVIRGYTTAKPGRIELVKLGYTRAGPLLFRVGVSTRGNEGDMLFTSVLESFRTKEH